MNKNYLYSDEKVIKLTMIEEKAKLMIGVKYRILLHSMYSIQNIRWTAFLFEEMLYSEDVQVVLLDEDIDEYGVYIDRWRVL